MKPANDYSSGAKPIPRRRRRRRMAGQAMSKFRNALKGQINASKGLNKDG